jgi:hypothetical protein
VFRLTPKMGKVYAKGLLDLEHTPLPRTNSGSARFASLHAKVCEQKREQDLEV